MNGTGALLLRKSTTTLGLRRTGKDSPVAHPRVLLRDPWRSTAVIGSAIGDDDDWLGTAGSGAQACPTNANATTRSGVHATRNVRVRLVRICGENGSYRRSATAVVGRSKSGGAVSTSSSCSCGCVCVCACVNSFVLVVVCRGSSVVSIGRFDRSLRCTGETTRRFLLLVPAWIHPSGRRCVRRAVSAAIGNACGRTDDDAREDGIGVVGFPTAAKRDGTQRSQLV